MDVLVDFNNVREADRRRGVVFVVDKIVNALGFAHLQHSTRLSVRLYDGWYENQTLTRKAQQVSLEVSANTAMTRTLADGSRTHKLIINTELAYSLRSAPGQHLWHTFRPRDYRGDITCRHPSTAGCSRPACPLVALHYFLTHGRCPDPGCSITPHALFSRSEQKLVDTMIAADLFSLHLQSVPRVAVVSSDDDLWPPIKLLTQLGIHVVHVHTIPGHTTPTFYSRGVGSTYTQLHL